VVAMTRAANHEGSGDRDGSYRPSITMVTASDENGCVVAKIRYILGQLLGAFGGE